MPILSYCWSVTLSIKSVSKNWNLEILDDNHWDCIAVVGESFLIDVNENTNLNTSTVCISFLCSYIVAFFKYVNGTCIVAYIYIYILICNAGTAAGLQMGRQVFQFLWSLLACFKLRVTTRKLSGFLAEFIHDIFKSSLSQLMLM